MSRHKLLQTQSMSSLLEEVDGPSQAREVISYTNLLAAIEADDMIAVNRMVNHGSDVNQLLVPPHWYHSLFVLFLFIYYYLLLFSSMFLI